jgi:putative hydrolase of the HAD superfamily
MIPIFDLDDTLYPERTFVESGFLAVAEMLEATYGWDKQASLSHMLDVLKMQGRGAVFNELLLSKQQFSDKLVKRCRQTYRQHEPRIALFPVAKKFLDANRGRPMYLVTDGNKNVQANKVRVLGIGPYFKKVFITHRYGLRNAKPSVYCFELIRQAEGCTWADMVYVGDNPAMDFVNLNLLGALTVRVQTGEHRSVLARPGYDAQISIPDLEDLPEVLAAHF